MAMETAIQISGSALVGIEPKRSLAAMQRFDKMLPLDEQSETVCLGRKWDGKPLERMHSIPQLADFIELQRFSSPDATSWRNKASASLSRMYMNDRYGCCVISGKAGSLGVWGANDNDSGGEIFATDNEVYQQYQQWCGPGDNGCYIVNVLDKMKSQGFTASGKKYLIDGYVGVNHANVELVKAAIHLFGPVTIGFMLPQSWTNSAVWDVTNSRIIGGHDVCLIDYDSSGCYARSWGRVYLMTWRAVQAAQYIDEMYAILAPAWYNNDKLAPSGVNVDALRTYLVNLGGGVVPVVPPVPPVVPPVPPVVPPVVPPSPPIPSTGMLYAVGGIIRFPDGSSFDSGFGDVPLNIAVRDGKLYIAAGVGGAPRVQIRDYHTKAVLFNDFIGDRNSRTGVNVCPIL